jgi:NTE family protein
VKALVLSGGGSRGAYQVGALRRLLVDQRRDYDIVCGISVGALNGAMMCQAPLGSPELAYEKLTEIWDVVTPRKVWKHRFLWYIAALWSSSVYDSSPLEKWVREALDVEAVRASKRKLRVGAVNWKTAEYRVVDELSADLANWVLASASFPVFFKPIKIEGEEWTDGGVRHVTPIGAAIRAGATDIDVIMTSNPEDQRDWKPKGMSALWRALRAIEIALDEVTRGDLKEAGLKNDLARLGGPYKDVKIRLLQPSRPLGVDSLDFDPKGIKSMRDLGYEDAINLV